MRGHPTLLVITCLVVLCVLGVMSIQTTSPMTPTKADFPSFYDDTIPLESDLDCGEATALLQRTLQLELAIKTSKHVNLVGKSQDPFYTSRLLSGDLSDDYTVNHMWFASCNHQNRAQALWYHLYRRTILEPFKSSTLEPQFLISDPTDYPELGDNEMTPIDPGSLFLFLGDAVYLDRPPNPSPLSPASQRTDATRQLWRKHYCSSVRRQIPVNGMIDDHDFGLNNAHSEFEQKFRTKDLFLDFIDLPDPVELGSSRQFSQLAALQCGAALGCRDDSALKTTAQNDQNGQSDGQATQQANKGDMQAIVDLVISSTCMAKIKETIAEIHQKTNANQYKELSKKYSGTILDQCYLNYNAILRYDPDVKSYFSSARGLKYENVFDSNVDLSALFTQNHQTESTTDSTNTKPEVMATSQETMQQLQQDSAKWRAMIEDALKSGYDSRRQRHGTSDVSVMGPLFRRVKTLLVDIRVTAIDYERQLAESHWAWVKEHLFNSVIPSLEESIWGTNRRNRDATATDSATSPFNDLTLEQKNEFLSALDQIRYEYSTYSATSGDLTINAPIASQLRTNADFKAKFQCGNEDFSSANYLKWVSSFHDNQFIKNGADIITVTSGILIASWGKFFSEGWRTTPGERTRMLELTARAMAISRQNVDEWRLFFQTRETLCQDAIPLVTFRDDPSKNGGNDRFLTQLKAMGVEDKTVEPKFSRIPITSAMKPLAIVYLTGDIHYAEAARTYLPIDLSLGEPKVVSNLEKGISIQTKFETLFQELMFAKHNDTDLNGKTSQDHVRQYSKLINTEIESMVNGKWKLDDVIKEEKAYRDWKKAHPDGSKDPKNPNPRENFSLPETSLFDRYVAPIADITTSGITHAWGGYSYSSASRHWAIKSLFNTVLRPSVTNIDYTTKHHWLVDELQDYYRVTTNKADMKVKLTTGDFEQQKKQSRFFIYHNIGDIMVDWDHDLLHIMVRNVTMEPALRFNTKLEHHRAYSMPQMDNFKTRISSYQTLSTTDLEARSARINYSYGLVAKEIDDYENEYNLAIQNAQNLAQNAANSAQNIASNQSSTLSQSIKSLATITAEPIRTINFFIKDLQLQAKAESGARFQRGFELTKTVIFMIFMMVLVTLILICYGSRRLYVSKIRPMACPLRHQRKEKERLAKLDKKAKLTDSVDGVALNDGLGDDDLSLQKSESTLSKLGQKIKSFAKSGSRHLTHDGEIDNYSEYGLDVDQYAVFKDHSDDGDDLNQNVYGGSNQRGGTVELQPMDPNHPKSH